MGWPTDPERRAAALERHRASQQARWARNDGERERLRDTAMAQWSMPGMRELMSQIKRRNYEDRPELALLCSAPLRARQRPHTPERVRAIRDGVRRAKVLRAKRLLLIKRRAMLVCVNESSTQSQG